jgi:Fe-S oxidoreductase/electron transfer flavoprotein alpha/beta subunit
LETRELFWDVNPLGYTLFYCAAWSAIAIFLIGVIRHVVKYLRGCKCPVAIDLLSGISRMLADIFSQRTISRRDRLAGHAHGLIFYGFVLLFVATSIITVEYDFTEPVFGVKFWHGPFYLGFSLVADLAGLGLLFGIGFMMWRRWRRRPAKLNYQRDYVGEVDLRPEARAWRAEDAVFLWALALIVVTGFVQEGVRFVYDRPAWAGWSPVGWLVAELLGGLGMDQTVAAVVRRANWWMHGMLALAFIAAIPWHKAKHMIAVLISLATRDLKALRRLPPAVLEADTAIGVASIDQFSWKDMLNFDACTKCGRCHEACPARTTGAPLSPRDLILDLRDYAERTQGRGGVELVSEVIAPETLWACLACGACMEICPVGIEHPPMIVQMRRHLVERGTIDPRLQDTLETIGVRGNSFGERTRARGAWTNALEFRVKDIREEPAEYLWFVGDYASYDPRNQRVSRTVARLFHAAGLDFAILYDGERTAGNDVRRVGEEGLYVSLVEHNVAQMVAAKRFERIITTDPHSYNTIRNEYPEFAEIAPICHYTAVLATLLSDRRLKITKPLRRRVTFHDPCHLGRLNGSYDEPRKVLELIGCQLIEMPRNRDNSFCCGAGGGRIWMSDTPGQQRPAENRVNEAAALGDIDTFVVCCPKDMTMFEDARKSAGHENNFVVQDLAELVAEAIALDSYDLEATPSFIETFSSPRRSPTQARSDTEPVAECRLVTAAELPFYQVPPKAGPRILVAVKQVGHLDDQFQIADDELSIPVEFFEFELNEWDDAALEEALLLTDRIGAGEVVAVTIGPEQSEEVLRRALAKGAHRAVRVWDDSLAPADSITIARALAGVARQENPDLILTGAQSGDLAHGATGVAAAGILNLPHAAVVLSVEWDGGARMNVTRELEGGVRQRIALPVPALLTIQTGGNTPRYATMRMIKQAKQKPISVLDGASVGLQQTGAIVQRIYGPERTGRARMFTGSAAEVALAIADIVHEKRGD